MAQVWVGMKKIHRLRLCTLEDGIDSEENQEKRDEAVGLKMQVKESHIKIVSRTEKHRKAQETTDAA